MFPDSTSRYVCGDREGDPNGRRGSFQLTSGEAEYETSCSVFRRAAASPSERAKPAELSGGPQKSSSGRGVVDLGEGMKVR